MIRRPYLALAAVAVLAVSACQPSESPAPSGSPSASGALESPGTSPGASAALTTIRVQLPGPIDGEFAGYIAAQKLGYFSDDGLAITFLPGDPDPATRSVDFYRPGASGPQFTVSDVASVLGAREHRASDLVDIAQIFQRSGTVVLTWKKDAIAGVCGLKGKQVGLWAAPGDVEINSSLAACPLAAGKDYTRVDVARDASAFLGLCPAPVAGCIPGGVGRSTLAATEGVTYDTVAQVLEAINPATKQQYTPDDLSVLPLTDRTATLQDAIFASAAWLAQTGNRDLAQAFIRASVRGWVYCRDHQEDCVQFTTQAGTGLGTSHTRWMINEVNALIWPSPDGIGTLDPIQWRQTITVATRGGVISRAPDLTAYDDTIVPDALAILAGKDLAATDYKKQPMAVAPGGK
jgi:NitT/TauT family transport system substrate-binding protein